MSYCWNDLSSKSDIFTNVLPLFNDSGSLETNFGFKLTSSPNNGKYSFFGNHTDGKRGNLGFKASQSFTEFHNTKLGFQMISKKDPEVTLTAKFTDDLIPITGSALNLKLSVAGQDESISANFHYQDKRAHGNFEVSVPLDHQVFKLAERDDDHSSNYQINAKVLVRALEDNDIYVGFDSAFILPNTDEKLQSDIKAVIATKHSQFDGGLYARHKISADEQDKSKIDESTQFGGWVTTQSNDITVASHLSYDVSKNSEPTKGFNFENFISFNGSSDDKFLVGLQVVPKTSLSVGYARELNKNTKFSFGYAYLLSATEDKSKASAFRFGLELSH